MRDVVRRAGLLALSLCSACGIAWLLAAFDAPGDRGLAAAKLDHWCSHADAYDTLFVGSSRVYRNVDPVLFDESTARAASPTSSFDLGLPGMSFLEALHTSHALLDARPAALRTLVVELLPSSVDIPGRNAESARVRAWHDLRTTRAAVRLASGLDDTFAARLDAGLEHVALWAGRALHQGSGRRRFEELFDGRYDAETRAVLPRVLEGRGHLALEDDDDPRVAARRARFLDEVDALRARNAAFVAGTLDDVPTDPTALELLAELARRAQGLGVRLVLVAMPVHRRFEAERDAVAAGRLPADLVVLADPVGHPELYAPERHFDANHLDREGTARLTELLAARIVELSAR